MQTSLNIPRQTAMIGQLGLQDVFVVVKLASEIYHPHPRPPRQLQWIKNIFAPAGDEMRDRLDFRHFSLQPALEYVENLVQAIYPQFAACPSSLPINITFLGRWYHVRDNASLHVALRELELCINSRELNLVEDPPCLWVGWPPQPQPRLAFTHPISAASFMASSTPIASHITTAAQEDSRLDSISNPNHDQGETPRPDGDVTTAYFELFEDDEVDNDEDGTDEDSNDDNRNIATDNDWAQPLRSDLASPDLIPTFSHCLTRALKEQPVLSADDETDMKAVFQLVSRKDDGVYEELQEKQFPGTLQPLSQVELRLVYRFVVKMVRNPFLLGQCICDLATTQPVTTMLAICALIRLTAMIKRHIEHNPDYHLPFDPSPGPGDRCPSGSSFGVRCPCEHGNPLSQLSVSLLPGLFMLVFSKRNMRHCEFVAASYFSPIIHDEGHPLQGQSFVSVRRFDEGSDLLEPLPRILQGVSKENDAAAQDTASRMRLQNLLAGVHPKSSSHLKSSLSHQAGKSIEPLLREPGAFAPPMKLTYDTKSPLPNQPNSVLLLMDKETLSRLTDSNVDNYSVFFAVQVADGSSVHAAVSLPLSPSLVMYDDLGTADEDTQAQLCAYFSRLRNRAVMRADSHSQSAVKTPRFLFLSNSIMSGEPDHLSMPYRLFQGDPDLQRSFVRLIQGIYRISEQTPASLLKFWRPQPLDDDSIPSLEVMAQQLVELVSEFFCH